MNEKLRTEIHRKLSGQGITFYRTRNRTLGFQIGCKYSNTKKKVEKDKIRSSIKEVKKKMVDQSKME